jgi:glutamate-1-semialdehyde 2,1-aminomutase
MERARRRIPGGVNSPVRAFGAVGGQARFICEARGAYLTDVDGQRYVDYVASWGAVICGHAHPAIVEAVGRAAQRGTSFGAPTAAEVELAERVAAAVPACEMLRLVSSGTEAVMSALRLARAATGRDKLIKFDGCYHGHADALLAAAGSGVATFGLPGTRGVPAAAVADTIVVPYNDAGAVREALRRWDGQVAAVIVEPIAANMGLVLPAPGFLASLREQCDRSGALLIFDEVITGFRVARGGAQTLLGVRPDLMTFGKVIGGGLPIGAYGGRRDLMEQIAPSGAVYQAGTLSGNPLATAAGLAALDLLEREGIWDQLGERSAQLAQGIEQEARAAGVPLCAAAVGGLWGFCFRDSPPLGYADMSKADHRRYAAFFHAMLAQGVYLAPSGYEAAFVTSAHGASEVERTLEAARGALARVA